MGLLIAFIIILIDKKLGYMKKISLSKVGKFLYSTNKRIIITTIVLGVVLITLYGLTHPFGINNSVTKILYYCISGIIVAMGFSQEKINRINESDSKDINM